MTALYKVQLVGEMYWPMGVPGATERTFIASDDEDAREMAVTTEAGDFSRLLGYRLIATMPRGPFGQIDDWSTLSDQHTAEEIEMLFLDCMYPSEDDA